MNCCEEKEPTVAVCGCCAREGHEKPSSLRRTLLRLGVAFILAVAAYFAPVPEWCRAALFGAAYLIAGGGVLLAAWRNIRHGRIFDENFLMGIASLGAFAVGEMSEAVAVMIFYGVGEAMQEAAVAGSRRNIEKLMDLRPDSARVKRGDEEEEVNPDEVKVNEIIIVRPGERIPLDGEVVSGQGALDVKALTGEPAPRVVEPGDEVLSGSVALDSLLNIRVSRPFGESTVARILELVRSAGERKSRSEKFITRFARIYTPSVVALAAVTAVVPPLAGFGSFSLWIYRALCFLIISCPCALVLSIPLSYFGGIGGAARRGVLVKGGNYLELLEKLDTVVFDKTGTLTRGVFKVVNLHPASGVGDDELLRAAAFAESQSRHPIARAISEAFGGDPDPVAGFHETAGQGVTAVAADGREFSAGNAALMRSLGIGKVEEYPETTVHVALDGRYLGCLLIADELKPDSKLAVAALRAAGVRKLVMLTGDGEAAAAKVAAELGLDEYKYGLLPHEKVGELERLMAGASGTVAFAGDGINDAPVLTRADLGIAMGGIGSDAAIEAADVVVMNDAPSGIAEAVRVAVKTRSIVMENIVMALGVKGAIMVLAYAGYASVWFAIFADVGVALLALLNALRPLRVPESKSVQAVL